MNCAEVYGWLQAYLDAGVSPEQERAVEAHIRACPDCRRLLVELARAVNVLERTGAVSPRADFTRRLYETLEKEAGLKLSTPRGKEPSRRPGPRRE